MFYDYYRQPKFPNSPDDQLAFPIIIIVNCSMLLPIDVPDLALIRVFVIYSTAGREDKHLLKKFSQPNSVQNRKFSKKGLSSRVARSGR
jgi:hypothetical protein